MAAALLSPLLLLLLLLGAGSLVCFGLQERASWLERGVLRVVVGAAALPGLQIAAYELFGLPIRPWGGVALGAAGLVSLLVQERRRLRSAAARAVSEPPAHRLALLVVGFAVFWSCLKGSLAFPSFEGRDPWGHALGARYLIETGIPRQPFKDWPILHYVDAYPPLFDVLLSLAGALGGSLNASLKGVASLVAGLGVPVFYYLVLRLLGDPRRAAVATALWAVLPGNLTRHVWAHSLALVLTFAALHAALRLRESRRWLLPGAIAWGGLLLAAPTAAINAGALLLIGIAALWRPAPGWARRALAQGMLGLCLAAVWYLPAFARHGMGLRLAMESPAARRDRAGRDAQAVVGGAARPAAVPTRGRAAPPPRRYGVDDFLFFRPYAWGGLLSEPKFAEEIAPVGLGLPLSALALGFLVVGGRRRPGPRLLRLWLAATLALALGPHLGLDFYAWRGWLLLCPLAAAAAAEALGSLAAAPAPPAGKLARAALGTLLVASAVNAGLAALWDFSGSVPARAFWSHGDFPGPESPAFYLAANPVFGVAILGAALLGVTALARRVTARRGRPALAGLALLAQITVAAPIRLRTLTGFIQPVGYASEVEYSGYLLTLEHTRPGDRVFPVSGPERAQFLIGLDRACRPWDAGEQALTRRLARPDRALDAEELVRWLRGSGYGYLVFDPSYARGLLEAGAGPEEPGLRLAALRASPALEPVLRLAPASGPVDEGFYLFRVRPGLP